MSKTKKMAVDSKRIKSLLKEKGYTQKSFAEAVHINHQAFNRRINEAKMLPNEIFLVSVMLGCPEDVLLRKDACT